MIFVYSIRSFECEKVKISTVELWYKWLNVELCTNLYSNFSLIHKFFMKKMRYCFTALWHSFRFICLYFGYIRFIIIHAFGCIKWLKEEYSVFCWDNSLRHLVYAKAVLCIAYLTNFRFTFLEYLARWVFKIISKSGWIKYSK